MKLKEFIHKCYTYGKCDTCFEIMVIPKELDGDLNDNEIMFTIKSYYTPETYLQEKWLDAEVNEIHAIEKNVFLVAIDAGWL